MTKQQEMKSKLEQIGLPYKEVECYGSQIVVTAHSVESANKWAMILSRFAKVRRAALESLEQTVERKYVKVWRTYAVIE